MKNLIHNFCDCATCEKNQEKAEKYKRVDDLFTELEIPLPYDLWLVQSLHIRERLKNFFNADNVLTKSEYKQKILGDTNA